MKTVNKTATIMGIILLSLSLLQIAAAAPVISPASTGNNNSTVTNQTYNTISSTTTQIAAYINNNYVLVNNHTQVLDTPAVLIQDQVFVPAKNIADYMGVNLAYNTLTKLVELKTAKAFIQFDIVKNLVMVNGIKGPFDNIAMLSKGKLMVSLRWFADYTDAQQTYNPINKLFNITYVKQPDSLSDSVSSSRPVAKFTFTKASYRMGETIGYVDLSYDPDAEGIFLQWTGKQDAFFVPGTYPITLKVTDTAGNVSAVYTRSVTIENSLFMNEVKYRIYNQPVGTGFKTDWDAISNNFNGLPLLPKQETEDTSRKLLISDSPESITQTGILYQDTVTGKARLYADHINGTTEKLRFSIRVTNPTDQPITLQTTNKGEVYPSVYANLIGSEASVDFMLHDPSNVEPLIVPAGATLVYVQMPDFYPGQGVNLFYDVETDGPLQYSFVASDMDSPVLQPLDMLQPLAFDGHVRGSFPVTGKSWNVELSSFTSPTQLTISNGVDDSFGQGFDALSSLAAINPGNYGVTYQIHADRPRRMAILLLARGGPFKGPFKINGEITLAPASGVLSAFESVQVLARTTGTEDSLDLEFTPPAGSAFPIELIFYPLDDMK